MDQTQNTESGFRSLFRKDFTLVLIGQIISLFGNSILRFAMPLYILQESGSPALFGLVSASAMLPMALLSPVGGIIADRVNKQRIMVVLDTITATLIAAFMLLRGYTPVVPLVVTVLMLLYGIQALYSPAVHASIPLLCKEKDLMGANAAINLVQSLSGLLGPVAGGMLYGKLGLTPILTASCICFAFSAVIELFIRIPHKKRTEKEHVSTIIKSDMAESARFIVRDFPVMKKMLVILFAINLFLSSFMTIGMPVFITEHLGLSSELYGASQGVLAAGGLIGGLLAGVLGSKLSVEKSYRTLLVCGVAILPMGIGLLMLPPMACYLVITAMAFVMMLCATIFNIRMVSFVQSTTPTEIVGKVISFISAIAVLSQPLGQAMYGMLFEQLSGALWAVAFGAGIATFGITLFSRSAFRELVPVAESSAGLR